MTTAAGIISGEADLLCEACGYNLNGLSDGARCPECGVPTTESAPARRGLSVWERPGNLIVRFCITTADVLFQPRRFYRGLATRVDRNQSRRFGFIHVVIASLLLGIASYVHIRVFYRGASMGFDRLLDSPVGSVLIFSAVALATFEITTPIAARLTSWEARYRGYRLPLSVVRRGLDFHAAHYLAVVVGAAGTVIGYSWFSNHSRMAWRWDMYYLYTLCGEVIVSAVYLFWTYWIGMRNMLYANA